MAMCKTNGNIKGVEMKIWELEMKSGKVFRVAVENKNQEKRLYKRIADINNRAREQIISSKVIVAGIHNIADFEYLADTL